MILGACPHSADPQVKLCDLVSLVKAKLEQDGVIVREIRLNGSGASSVFHSLHHQHLILLGQIISVIFWSFSPRGLINADWVLSQDQQSLQSLCRFTSLSRHLLFLCLFSFYARMIFWSFLCQLNPADNGNGCRCWPPSVATSPTTISTSSSQWTCPHRSTTKGWVECSEWKNQQF